MIVACTRTARPCPSIGLRYALALKGVGYDFTVDGPVTDIASCLERTDALGAPIYTECRK